MRRSLILVLAIFSASIIFSSVLTPSVAADYTKVGVKVGDTAEYLVSDVSHIHGVNYTTGKPVYFYYDTTEAYDRLRVTVTNVTGTNVTLSLTLYFPNGKVYENSLVSCDVSSGMCDFFWPSVLWGLIIAANLSVGDPIYIGSSRVINETVNMRIASKYRLNHVGSPESGYEAYWDKASGLLVERHSESILMADTTYGGYTEINWINMTLMTVGMLGQMDVGSQVVTLFAAVATATMIIVVSFVADRRLRARSH
jgi:hypothetical protein